MADDLFPPTRIKFQPVTAGITNLNLTEPAG
jgi:hypothetical protein